MQKCYLTVLTILISIIALAQKGDIQGTVFDDETGETLVGVTIVVKGTSNGTISDLDGNFMLELAEGSYDLQVSYISFQTLVIEAVPVKANEVYNLNKIRLKSSSHQLGEVLITAEAVRKSEEALLTMKRKSVSILDGISSEKMQLTGDGTAVEAAKRVTGVSIEGGKYVYVRGLGDRYSKTTLNNVDIPGLDPDKNTIQLDIFPTNLIDNIMVSKNFTAELPADFTGGIMNIETKAFPDEKFMNISIGTSFNPSMHFNSDYLSYEGGKTDFLGFDDGSRALPDGARRELIPTPTNGYTPEAVNNFVGSFNPQLAAKREMSLMDFDASISLGDQISLKNKRDSSAYAFSPKLGYTFSLSYKTNYEYYDEVMYGEYQRFNDPDKKELRYATIQNGELSEKNVLVGALGGLAYKTKNSKYRLMAMRLQNGKSRAGKFTIDNDGQAVGQSGYFAQMDNLEYNQQSLSNLLLNGTHILPGNDWEIDWKLSPTLSTSEDPDIRKTAFTQTPVDTLFIAGAGGNPSRIWRSLTELNATAKIDITKDYKFKGEDAKLKFGASQTYKKREYEILFFDLQFFGSQSWPNPDPSEVLNPANIYPNNPNKLYYQSGNNNPNPNAYESTVSNTAFYASNELSLFPKLKTILGLRMENFVQYHTGRDQAYASGDEVEGRNFENEKVLESLDLFPSAILIYALNANQNLRFAYSQTIARPSFKELSFAQILDPITNRIFNGGLYAYEDWDGDLSETHINNLDLRWEMFLEGGQIFSASAFYKQFEDPIELVRIPEQQTSPEYQPRNVGEAALYGIELEIRKSLEFISPSLSNFNVNGNITLVESKVEMTETEYNARKEYEKTGETIEDSRPMAGQAPYVINAGLSYSDFDAGIDVGLFYNVSGSTLQIVGSGLFPDIYLEPFQSLNFSFNKKLGEEKNMAISLGASNILNDKRESLYKSFEAEDQPFSILNPGRSFSLGFSYAF